MSGVNVHMGSRSRENALDFDYLVKPGIADKAMHSQLPAWSASRLKPLRLYLGTRMSFQLAVSYWPKGDQKTAIAELIAGCSDGEKHQVLLGVTGSGKTFTMAKLIEQQRPARAGAGA